MKENDTISLSYSQIRNENFSVALRKLANHSGFNGRQAYHIGRIVDMALSEERRLVQEENQIHTKYARKNEDGTRYIPEGKSEFYFEVAEEHVENHRQEMEELYKEVVVIPKRKIPIDDLNHTGLTPAQMVALEPLIDDSEGGHNVLQMAKGSVQEQGAEREQPTT